MLYTVLLTTSLNKSQTKKIHAQVVLRVCSILTRFEVMHRALTGEVSHFKAFPLHAKQQCRDETFGRPQLAKFSMVVYPTSKHLIFEKLFCVP